jgi:hypothetical protein
VLFACLPPAALAAGAEAQTGVPETTKVLSEDTTRYLSAISGDGAVLTFWQSTPELLGLVPGDIIVSGVGPVARYGFLRRVTSVYPVGDQVVVSTVAASLKDAVREGTIRVSRTLTRDQVELATLAPGVTAADDAGPLARVDLARHTFNLDNVPVYDQDGNYFTTGDQIRATGRVSMTISVDYTVDVATDTETVDLTVDDSVDLRYDAHLALDLARASRQIAHHVYTPWTIWIGPLPVVIVPVLSLQIGMEGHLSADLSVGITHGGAGTVGLEREADGDIRAFGDIESAFGPIHPTVTGSLSLEAFAGPRLALRLYGPTGYGLFGELDAYLRLTATVANPPVEPWWQLFAGIELATGYLTPTEGHYGPIIPLGIEEELTSSGVDPEDDDCTGASLFRLDKNRAELWGGIEFSGDRDWASITAPATTKMLLALNLVGRAEPLPVNYDLELRGVGAGCSTRMGASRKDTTGAWGDERILVDVAADEVYRSGVFGRSATDYVAPVDGAPDSTYHVSVSFGNRNESFHLLGKRISKDRTPAPGAPFGVITVEMEFQNATPEEFRNMTFQVSQLAAYHQLLSADLHSRTGRWVRDIDVDDPSVRAAGAIGLLLSQCPQFDVPAAGGRQYQQQRRPGRSIQDLLQVRGAGIQAAVQLLRGPLRYACGGHALNGDR